MHIVGFLRQPRCLALPLCIWHVLCFHGKFAPFKEIISKPIIVLSLSITLGLQFVLVLDDGVEDVKRENLHIF